MMKQVILFVIIAAFSAGTISPAWAENGKGWFGFFNRNKGSESSPVHMTPGVQGTADMSSTKTLNLGKKAKIAREEDSPVYETERRNRQIAAAWSAEQSKIAQTRGANAVAALKTQLAYNEQVALKAQAERIALIQKNAAAGLKTPTQVAPQLYLQNMPAVMNSTEPTVTEKPEETKPAKPPREHKPRHFFNRTE